MTKLIKSPLRYPGGKTKAIEYLSPFFPSDFSEYREPMIGGGSVFIYLKQKFPHAKFWINDLNPDLYCFWKTVQTNLSQLVEDIKFIKDIYKDGKGLFEELANVDAEELTTEERAVRFFVLNRITFSGTIEAGGFSLESFYKRFTDSSIERLFHLHNLLHDVKITNLDYSELLKPEGSKVFIFLDPPYLSAKKSRLYGKRGFFHTSFDHDRFAQLLKKCYHSWMITYDNSPEIKQNFDWAYLHEWELQYGMNNYKQETAEKGKELVITNYSIESPQKEFEQLNLFSLS